MDHLQNNNFIEQINKVFLRIKEAARKDQNILAVYFFGSLLKSYGNRESDFDLAVVVDKKKQDSEDSVYELIRNIRFPKTLIYLLSIKRLPRSFYFRLSVKDNESMRGTGTT